MPTYTVPDGTSTIKDTFNRESTATTNNDGSSSFSMAGYGHASDKRVALLSFDLTARSASDTCTAASLTLNISSGYTVVTPRTINAYVMAAGNQDYDSATCTWNTKDGTNAWAGGASGGGAVSDRGALLGSVLMDAATYATDDPVVITLDADEVEAAFGGWLRIALLRTDTSSSADQFRSVNSTSGNYPLLSVDYTEVTAITVGSLTANEDAAVVARLTGTATVTTGTASDATAVLSVGGVDWSSKSIIEYSDSGSLPTITRTATIYAWGLTPNALNSFSLAWSSTGTISGTNPATTTKTTLAKGDMFNSTRAHAGARRGWMWSIIEAANNSDAATDDERADIIANFDFQVLQWQSWAGGNSRRVMNEKLITRGATALYPEFMLMQIEKSGTAIDSLTFDGTSETAFAAMIAADESTILHTTSASSATDSANRYGPSTTYYLNPTKAEALRVWTIQVCRFLLLTGGDVQSSSSYRFGPGLVATDNVHLRIPSGQATYEFAAGANATYRAGVLSFVQRLQDMGVTQFANITSATPGAAGYEFEEAAVMIQIPWAEAVNGFNPSDYLTADNWVSRINAFVRLMTPGLDATTGITSPADQRAMMTFQMIDPTGPPANLATFMAASDQTGHTPTTNLTAWRFAYFSYLCAADDDLERLFMRWASDANAGYDRDRYDATDLARVLGSKTTSGYSVESTSSGTGNERIHKVEFDNYTVYGNPHSSSRTCTPLIGITDGSGTLTARQVVFVPVVTQAAVPVFVHHYRQQGVQ